MANSNPVLLYQPEKLNFEKMKKMTRDIIILHHVYHKWRSYDVWFLRYWMWRKEFFVILDHFLPFYPLTTWKIKYNFTNVYHKWQSYDVWFLRYEAWWIEFFCYFGPVFALLPLKNQNFEKLKNTPEDITILYKCTKNYDHILFLRYGA